MEDDILREERGRKRGRERVSRDRRRGRGKPSPQEKKGVKEWNGGGCKL